MAILESIAKIFIPGLSPERDVGRISEADASRNVGMPGTAVFGGFVDDPEKDPRLKGRERYITYSEILANTAIVAAGVRYFVNLTAKAGWSFDPSDHPRGKELAELTERALTDDPMTPFHRIVRRAAMYRFYGFSLQEWTARRGEDGVVTFKDVAPRAQFTIEQWEVDEGGKVHSVIQRPPQDGRELQIPRGKLVYMVDDTLSDSPEGLGLFRHVVEPARRLQRFEQLEGFGFETDLRGMPVGRAPFEELAQKVRDGSLSNEERQLLERPLRDFIKNHVRSAKLGLLLDSTTYQTTDEAQRPSNVFKWGVDLLKAGATTQAEVNEAVERLNREIARILGVEGLLLGGDKVGSMALSRDKTHNFFLLVDSTLKEVRSTFFDDLITPLFVMNGWPLEARPQPRTEAIRFRDVEQIASALRDIAVAGAPLMPGDPATNEVRDLLGLSRPPSQEELGLGPEDSALTPGGRNGAQPGEDDTAVPNDERREGMQERR